MMLNSLQNTQRIGFIGRADILSEVDGLISAKEAKKVLCVEGGGGIGKTRLLAEVYHRYMHVPGLEVVEPLDFDNAFFHIPGNLEQHIAQRLGTESFSEYLNKLKNLRELEKLGASDDLIEQQENEMRCAFLDNMNSYAKTKRVILLLDTSEKLKNAQTWERLFAIMENVTNSILIIAGRKDEETPEAHNKFLELQSRLTPEMVIFKSLEPLKREESLLYINAKQRERRINLDETVVNGLLTLSQGHPILLDLAIEWISRNIPHDWILEVSQKQLSTSDLTARRTEFEKLLVTQIAQIRTRMDQLCLLLSRIYPLDCEGIAQLLRISLEDGLKLYNEATTYVFIKRLPGNHLSLHDEMRRMIQKYVWGAIDPHKERRVRQSEQAKEYLRHKIQEAPIKNEASPSSSAVSTQLAMMEYVLEQEKWVLRGMYLFHALYANFEDGIKEFICLFDEDTSNNAREILIDQIEAEEFREKNAGSYRHEIISRKVDLLKRKGDLLQALWLGEQMLLATEPDLRLDALIKVANIKTSLGRSIEAISHLNEALQICEKDGALIKWRTSVLNMLGFASRTIGRLSDALAYYKKALSELRSSENPEKVTAAILNNLGYVTAQDGRYRSALKYCQQALVMRQANNDRIEIGSSFSTIGEVHRNRGEYEDALVNYDESLKIFESENARAWLSRVYSFRGAVYRLQNKFDQAETDLKKSIEFDVPSEKPWAYHVLGCVYWERNDLDAALGYFKESYTLAEKFYDIRTQVNNLVVTAEIHYQQWINSAKTDRTLIDKITPLADKLKNLVDSGYDFPHHFGRMLRILGDIAFESQEYDHAIQVYAEAYAMLGKRAGGYGRRTFYDELEWLEKRIDALAETDAKKAVNSCNSLMGYWSDENRPISRRDELISFCDVMLIKHDSNLQRTI